MSGRDTVDNPDGAIEGLWYQYQCGGGLGNV